MSIQPRKHILILDDDIDIVNLISKVLTNIGHGTHYAVTTKDFYDQLPIVNPHLIIIDQKLEHSKEDGIHVVQFLKKNPLYKNIPIFLISASPTKQLLTLATTLGAEEFITKPLVVNTFLQKVKKTLRTSDFPEINLSEHKRVTCQIDAEIKHISESALRISGPVKFIKNIELKITAPFLDKLGCKVCRYKTSEFHKVLGPGEYLNEIRIKGIKEETARQIRLIKKTAK